MLSNAAPDRKRLFALAVLFLLPPLQPLRLRPSPPTREHSRACRRRAYPAAVDVLLCIRYAAAPEGAARWTPPALADSTHGHASWPLTRTGLSAGCQRRASARSPKDCLFLNVYVPATATLHSKLPTFVWIHGGGAGHGNGCGLRSSVMVAENDAIVVTINYRLGALGWLVEPGLLAQASSFCQNVGDAGNTD